MNRSCITQTGLVLLLVASMSCPALHAGFRPEQHVIVQSETNGAISVYTADLDGDGDLDVLSASYEDSKIAWYANDGTGHFGSQQVITKEARGAQCVYAADLDGDGDLDVLSASSYEDKITWYANDGSGQFSPQRVITTAAVGGTRCVYAADLDRDGDLDVLSVSNGYYYGADRLIDSRIAWYANDGSGHFGNQQVITTPADAANWVFAADLDGDGDLDVCSASWVDDKIGWYANDGTGQFGSQQVISTLADMAQCVYAADLDGDGDLDVLSASRGDDKIAWHSNDGTGQFGSQQVISTEADAAQCVYAADLDGDGDLDVLSASGSSWTGSVWTDSKIAWYANDGIGHFGPQQVITTEALGASCVYAADLDGDGDLDVLSASEGDDKIAWYANDGTGHFGPQQVITPQADGASCVYAGDLDGDGDLDVLSASANDDKIAWYANDGSGHLGPQQVITTAANFASSVYVADLDGDGDLDVLSASAWDDKIAWYANDGSGHFGSQQVISTEAHYAQSVYAADLDGDGDLDVLSNSSEDGKIAWYTNNGSGSFGPQQVITTAADFASSMYAADLDSDGDLDVLSASHCVGEDGRMYDSEIAWYANDGSGQFAREEVITTAPDYSQSVYAADLDGDGDLDVLSAVDFFAYPLGPPDHKIAWYANDGSGHFGTQEVITTETYDARSVCAADLDGDGDLDVLSAFYWAPFIMSAPIGGVDDRKFKIAWYANDGSGHFSSQEVITTAVDDPQSVYAADLDGDGDLDVLSASSGDDKIAWYENE